MRGGAVNREREIGDAAIAILAAKGTKGLTHRAIDAHLGWPEGSTSRYHRTRDSLLTAAVQRLLDEDLAALERWEREQVAQPITTRNDVAQIMARAFRSWSGPSGQIRQIARYELSLEGRRRPAVHEAILAGRRPLNTAVEHLLAASGCLHTSTHATALASCLDGLVHDRLLHPEITVDDADIERLFAGWLLGC